MFGGQTIEIDGILDMAGLHARSYRAKQRANSTRLVDDSYLGTAHTMKATIFPWGVL
jgi:hypothetical protein